MAIFYRCTNNGTIAVVTQEVMDRIRVYLEVIEEWERERGCALKEFPPLPRPIFTFVRDEDYRTDRFRDFVTGTHELLDRLLKGHQVFEGHFYVPFSNHYEIQDGETARQERKFRTTVQELLEAFELIEPIPPRVW